jgi:hypothetical protein
MGFSEAEQQRQQLSGQLARGQVTQDEFIAAINAIRVTDPAGRIWQPDPGSSGWLCWNGTAWQAATPPGYAAPGGMCSTTAQKSAKDFSEFRSSLMTVDEFKKVSKEVPLAKRPQKWWDLLSILGGVVGAILWFLYGGVRSGREGFDFITPLLMILIPTVLVWFRADFDEMLMPLQPTRKKIAKILLIGMGIVTPFLTAWILYNIFNISQYPLIQANMVVGTFAAYAITRDPQTGDLLSKKGPVAGTVLIIFAVMLCSSVIAPALADDCTSDLLNAQDCLRTDGYAEAMAGLITAILSALINGPIIAQALLQGAAGTATGPQPPSPPAPPQGPQVGDQTTFVDARGETHTAVLQADGHWLSDKGTWYDPDYDKLLADGKRIDAENAAWRAQNAAQEAADAAKFRQMTDGFKAQLDAAKNYISPEKAAFDKWYREYLTLSQKTNEFQANMYLGQANVMNVLTRGAEWTEKGADISIDVLSKMTGAEGKAIKTAYTTLKDITKNVSSSYANNQDLKDGLLKGAQEAAFDFAFDKAKEKFIKATGGNVPFFKDFKGGNYGNLSDKFISNSLNNKVARNILEARIQNAAQGSMNNMVQGQVQKILVKDPLKKALGLK